MSGRAEPSVEPSSDVPIERRDDGADDRPTENAEPPGQVAVRMAPQLRLIQVGTASAALAVVTAVIALVDYPPDAGSDIWFPVGALVSAVAL